MIERIREICLALPETSERLSHGSPSFFVRQKKTFVSALLDGHHDNDFPHLWLAAAEGVQGELIAEAPDRFFRPPYVGHKGWIGIHLEDDADWDEVEDLIEESYRMTAPKRLAALLDQHPAGDLEVTR